MFAGLKTASYDENMVAPVSRNVDVEPYEARLNRDRSWAWNEGGMHFQEDNQVHKTVQKIASRLNELQIPYALAGGMALFKHGHRRFTEDVDLLVTSENLKSIHDALEGLGYVRAFAGSKRLRDSETGVSIDFLITGQFPGDGKPKPVAFPDPAVVVENFDGINVLLLPNLVELKLASGMTGAGRSKDIGDVEDVIRKLRLPLEFAEQLDPYVRDRFRTIWHEVTAPPPFES